MKPWAGHHGGTRLVPGLPVCKTGIRESRSSLRPASISRIRGGAPGQASRFQGGPLSSTTLPSGSGT